MKPPNVTSVLLLGPHKAHKSSFLIQGALHYAEQGHTVVYITANEFDSLPPPVQGQSRHTPEVWSLIKFLYLPRWQDLLHHLSSLHLHALVPSVLIVEALEHFCFDVDNHTIGQHSNAFKASQAALICAALLDGAAVCAKRSKTQAHLIVSINEQVSHGKLSPLIDIFFSDIVWTFQSSKATTPTGNESNQFSMTNLETAGSCIRQYKIVFCVEESDSEVVLSEVTFWDKIGRI